MSEQRRKMVEAEPTEIYDVELEEDLLQTNRDLAEENRRLLAKCGVDAIDIMGCIGSGKTTLIHQLVGRLKDRRRIAVFKGDLTTTIDTDIIARHGVETVQINTGRECHLDANLVRKALAKIDLGGIDLLFIENVGNLICPTDFPLGAQKRLVVISVTEGPYMVVKHSRTFLDAHTVVINKLDLAEAMKVDADRLEADVKQVNCNAVVVKTICRDGVGINRVIESLGV
ncbi:MAG: hydrogenase nickel incorporation protein HypB [Thaumarchaeota archaeon]|nr:hydrogenase nickel incorporation protein HypB [Nitrososphaerota archaeon]MCL5318462.1 hydrogenase nickel incorporation protein HypB [Nitrososphaerota archaeon]